MPFMNSPVRPLMARPCTNGWSMRAHPLMTISLTHVCTQCYTCTLLRGHPRGRTAKRHGLLHPSFTEGEDTPHSSPSQTGGLLSAATAPPLTTGAELETLTACTVPSLPVKAHLTTLLAGGWSCMSPSGDRFLRQATPGDRQQEEVKTKDDILGQWITNGPSPCTFCI